MTTQTDRRLALVLVTTLTSAFSMIAATPAPSQTDALHVNSDGDVGIGTSSPGEALHVVRGEAGDVHLKLESTSSSGERAGIILENNAATFKFYAHSNSDFILHATGGAGAAIKVKHATGKVIIPGDLLLYGDCTGCDAVFDASYPLESIAEHKRLMYENRRLPGIGRNLEGATEIDVFDLTTGTLNELEKAHIYIAQLHETIQRLERRLQTLEQHVGGPGSPD